MAIRAEKLKEWCGHYTVMSGEIDRDFDQILKERSWEKQVKSPSSIDIFHT